MSFNGISRKAHLHLQVRQGPPCYTYRDIMLVAASWLTVWRVTSAFTVASDASAPRHACMHVPCKCQRVTTTIRTFSVSFKKQGALLFVKNRNVQL